MRLWRLSKARHAASAMDGEGARLVGGRWSSPGRKAVYLSEHLSLAALEILVHVSRDTAPAHVAIALEVPDELMLHAETFANLPTDWRDTEAPLSTRALGDAWLDARTTALLRVPSVLIPEEFNVILNPRHPDAARIKQVATAPFVFDPRLFKS